MPENITPLTLPMPMGLGRVNAYLLRAKDGFVLVDTGAPNAWARLQKSLEDLGCRPGQLKLIVITHGDFDHTGNAARLRRAFGSPIGMHAEDAPMAEQGDMFVNRAPPNALLKALIPRLIGFSRSHRFTPDVLLKEGASLEAYGLQAQVIGIPGHSKGSIGILTAEGDFLCGDLFENTKQPTLNGLIDDRPAALASLDRLRGHKITCVYPGHGPPFPPDQLA